jgi:hypothetical protein
MLAKRTDEVPIVGPGTGAIMKTLIVVGNAEPAKDYSEFIDDNDFIIRSLKREEPAAKQRSCACLVCRIHARERFRG